MNRFTVLFFLGAFLLSACSTARWIRSPVLKQKEFTVTLEQRLKKGKIIQQKFAHPYSINLPEFQKLLKDLTYIEEAGLFNKEIKRPVFQAVEIDRLAPALADALAKADTRQRIRFISFNRGKALIFSVRRETEGVVFIEANGHLNIAFTFINSTIDPMETPDTSYDFTRIDPVKIKDSVETIIPAASYSHRVVLDAGKKAPMWIVADLEKLKKASNSSPVPNIGKKNQTSPAASPENKSSVSKTERTVPVKSSDKMLQQDIKNKLKYLKDLLDEGLISEKDYNTKKMELLDKIH